jgi:hypothetical protein
MRRMRIYYMLFLLFLFSCESIYIAELDEVASVLVADARLVYGKQNLIYLYKSKGFNETDAFEPANAIVQLQDDRGETINAIQDKPGTYLVNYSLHPDRKYRLQIIAGGEIYVSTYESVPPQPSIDSAYIDFFEKWVQPGGETDVGSFIKRSGQQFYVDIHDDKPGYYRFTSRTILQYTFPFDTLIGTPVSLLKYCWKSFYPHEVFNLAAPSEYTSRPDIMKFPAEFLGYYDGYIESNERGEGWIYIMHQYRISESAYRYYIDLNSQLGPKGKIFDPLYVQARNNLTCISNPEKNILGNFEISTHREYRYLVKLNRFSGINTIRKIEQYHDIPERGIRPMYKPYFWED